MLQCSSVPILRVLRNFLLWRRPKAWRFGLRWDTLCVRRLPLCRVNSFTPLVPGTPPLPIELSQVLLRPAGRRPGVLVVCPAPASVAACSAAPLS